MALSSDLYHGDCLEVMAQLPDASVDMILCDLPYGTTACKWDTVIPFEPLWAQYRRIAKRNAAIVLTASQPFTTALIASNMRDFRYCLVWHKKFGIPAHARIRPMRVHEDVAVFGVMPPRYFPQMVKRDKPIKSGGNKCASVTSPLTRVEGWSKTYTEKFPVSILDYPRDLGRTVHPTQKPVALMEYLIRTYTREGETVLDNCMGSGTTGVACANTGRQFIGIERDDKYFAIASERIANARRDLFAA